MIEANDVSQTALTAAAARAAHLIVDHEPVIFADTLASQLLGDRAEELIGYHRAHGSHLVLSTARAEVTVRSRYAEDALAASGLRQYVLLGAGLDTFAWRSPLASQLAVFEVDHPATQDWKRARMPAAGTLRYVPVDLAAGDLAAGDLAGKLAAAGFDLARPALVSWLGVTMYLSRAAIAAVLAAISQLAPGTELITEYLLPAGLRDETGDSYVEQVMPFAAERGEPWLSFFRPEELSFLLGQHGLGEVRHIAQADVGGERLWRRTDSLRPSRLSQLARARLLPR